VEQPIVQVPAELVMGPRCDLWADPDHLAAFERASTAAERMTPRDSCMISARRNHRDAIHAWAEQTGRTWRQAHALITSRRAVLAGRRKRRRSCQPSCSGEWREPVAKPVIRRLAHRCEIFWNGPKVQFP